MTSNPSQLIGAFILGSPGTVSTITNYNLERDSYYLESSNGRDKSWVSREMIEIGLSDGSIRQAFPIWMSLNRPLGSRLGGEIIIPSSISTLPPSC